jgi:hypothetical protein
MYRYWRANGTNVMHICLGGLHRPRFAYGHHGYLINTLSLPPPPLPHISGDRREGDLNARRVYEEKMRTEVRSESFMYNFSFFHI